MEEFKARLDSDPEMDPISHYEDQFLLSSLAVGDADWKQVYDEGPLPSSGCSASVATLERMAAAASWLDGVPLTEDAQAVLAIIKLEINLENRARITSSIARNALKMMVEAMRPTGGLDGQHEQTEVIEYYLRSDDGQLGDFHDLARIDIAVRYALSGNSLNSIDSAFMLALQRNMGKLVIMAYRGFLVRMAKESLDNGDPVPSDDD
jgi:hypothetical protein